jgi:hypothetical protein
MSLIMAIWTSSNSFADALDLAVKAAIDAGPGEGARWPGA